jgi:hypothetical protein
MEQIRYPWRKKVEYQSTEEYQEQLAALMCINEQGEHVSIMDELYLQTKEDSRIMELCSLAAEKCLLTPDAEYGQIMMFSYDCFAKFHTILQWYFGNRWLLEKGEGEGAMELVEEKIMEDNYEWLKQYFQGQAHAFISK